MLSETPTRSPGPQGGGLGQDFKLARAAAGKEGLRRLGASLPLALQLPPASLSPLLHSAAALAQPDLLLSGHSCCVRPDSLGTAQLQGAPFTSYFRF